MGGKGRKGKGQSNFETLTLFMGGVEDVKANLKKRQLELQERQDIRTPGKRSVISSSSKSG